MHRLLVFGATALAALALSGTAAAWSWPADGQVLRPFALGGNAYAAGQHRGIDVAGPDGSPVRAPASGTVTFAGSLPTHGRGVTIATADGYAVTLVHLGSIDVAKGDPVTEGASIGTMGSSGEPEHPVPSVHLGIRVASQSEGYVDPLGLLPPRAPVATPPQTSTLAPAPVPTQAAPSATQSSSSSAASPTIPSAPQHPVPAAQLPVATQPPAPSTTAAGAASAAPPVPSSATAVVASPAATHAEPPLPPAGAAERAAAPSQGAHSAGSGRSGGIEIRTARGAPAERAGSASSPTRSPARPTPRVGTSVALVDGARSSTPLTDDPPRVHPRAVTAQVDNGSAARAAPRLSDPQGLHAGGVVGSGVGDMTASSSGADVMGRPAERVQLAGGRAAAPALGLHSDPPSAAGRTRPEWDALAREAEATGRDIGTIAALAALVLLLAVAACGRAARRIGADGAVLRHHPDLLRQLHAAHRARVHDGGSGCVRTPSAATRP